MRLILFYIALVIIGGLLITYVPLVRHAWVSSPIVDGGKAFPKLSDKTGMAASWMDRGAIERIASVFLIAVGSLLLVVPVAWVYTFTRRFRYDSAIVHSIIILPLVAAGIVVIVKDSVALAFSLAGTVGIVRFRNTLKDPKDTVYIFLALAIALAAGVQALDIALVLSATFNFVVLILWKYNLGAMYGEGTREILSIGDERLMIARTAAQRDALRWRLSEDAEEVDADGILVVHSHDEEAAKQAMEVSLSKVAKEWRFVDRFRQRDGIRTFAVLMELNDKKGDPMMLLGDIDERWSQEVPAAEYLPYRKVANKKSDKKKSDEKKD